MLKTYLKQICDLEGEVQERSLKLDKANEECKKTQKRISEEKERLKKILQAENAKVTALEEKRKEVGNYYPKGVSSTAIKFVVAIVVTLLMAFGIKALVLNVFDATDAASATTAYMVINILPIVVIWLFVCVGDEFTWGKTALFAVIYVVINLLTFGYFMIFEENGKSISFAMMFFTGILLALELLSGVITCLVENNKQEKRYLKNRRYLRESEKELAKLKQNAETANNNLAKYIVSSQKAEKLMKQDIETQLQLLDVAKLNLKKLYAKNILHPKYQEWVAAATIYEYLDTGICKTFEGHEGAYKFYEEQLIGKQIVSSLSSLKYSIERQGDRIVGSQNYIRSQLVECNRKLDNYRFNTYGY